MPIPLRYNLRNLWHRPGATAMTALGIALTVTTALFILALVDGLHHAFVTTGDAANVLVMRKGSDAELSSVITQNQALLLKALPEVAAGGDGRPLASSEMVIAVVLPRRDGTGEVNVTLRGMQPAGLELRPEIHLVAGRWFRNGQREVAVPTTVAKRFAHAGLGEDLVFGKGSWRVVGLFDAAGTAHASEIWADVDEMAGDFDRPVYSAELLHAASPAAAQALIRRIGADQSLALDSQTEPAYFAKQTASGNVIQGVGTVVALIMAIGACFAAMNTMYAAVANRGREIGTLRILGFSRPAILLCFVAESVLLALLGGVAGVLLVLPFNGMSTGTFNMVTFSEVVFTLHLTPRLIATAMGFAVVMGAIGGLAPAWHAARQEILATLR